MLKEFKEFAFKGNLIDMAVGIIIGGAFATVATSFVKDIVMPPIAYLAGGNSWADKIYVLGQGAVEGLSPEEVEKAKATLPVIAYGNFITNLVAFLIIAFVIFILVKKVAAAMNVPTEEEAPPPPAEEVLLTEIRDLLKKG